MIHVTETRFSHSTNEWIAFCRCGWTGSYLATRNQARKNGDAHLAEANGEGA